MPGKSNVYTLGEFGVNRVKSPVHLTDGELLTAQNAEVSFDKGNRGLRKRAGLAKLTTAEAAAGSVLAMTNIPYPDPGEDALSGPGTALGFEVFSQGGAQTTRRTTDGTNFSNKSVAGVAEIFFTGQPVNSYFFDGRLYYNGDTLGQILYYDGSASGIEATLPSTHPLNASPLTSVNGLCGLGDRLFILAQYDSPYFQVMTTRVGTGAVSVFCEGFKNTAGAEVGFLLRSTPIGPVAFQGEIFIGAADSPNTTGYVYRAGIASSAWTTDETFASSRFPNTFGGAGDSLWLTTDIASANYSLHRRDADGTWTVVRGPQGAFVAVCAAYQQRVYLVESSNLERSTDNGGAFTTIATGTIASSGGAPGKLTFFAGSYYLYLNAELVRDDGASVTEIATGVTHRSAFVRI